MASFTKVILASLCYLTLAAPRVCRIPGTCSNDFDETSLIQVKQVLNANSGEEGSKPSRDHSAEITQPIDLESGAVGEEVEEESGPANVQKVKGGHWPRKLLEADDYQNGLRHQAEDCADDPDYFDSEYGDGTSTCNDGPLGGIALNPSWCTSYGDYSLDARRHCPIACKVCMRSESCEDDPDFEDSEYGDGTSKCNSGPQGGVVNNPSWCKDYGDYSLDVRKHCPVACGICIGSEATEVEEEAIEDDEPEEEIVDRTEDAVEETEKEEIAKEEAKPAPEVPGSPESQEISSAFDSNLEKARSENNAKNAADNFFKERMFEENKGRDKEVLDQVKEVGKEVEEKFKENRAKVQQVAEEREAAVAENLKEVKEAKEEAEDQHLHAERVAKAAIAGHIAGKQASEDDSIQAHDELMKKWQGELDKDKRDEVEKEQEKAADAEKKDIEDLSAKAAKSRDDLLDQVEKQAEKAATDSDEQVSAEETLINGAGDMKTHVLDYASDRASKRYADQTAEDQKFINKAANAAWP